MNPTWIPVFWAAAIAFAILVYVVLDGYDLGVGILFGTTRGEHHRITMMNAIAPFWDGNETWLVLIGAGLFATFPMVYAIFLPAFYLPIALMLLGLIFCGVAFEFRQRSQRMRPVWDWGFFLGSLTAAFVQGAAIGTMVQELPVVDGRYAGGAFEWVTPFSMLCGAGLVLGYALLGAAWLVLKTEGDLRDWAYRRLGCSRAWLSYSLRCLRSRWPPNCGCSTAPRFVVLQLLGVVAIIGLLIGVRRRHDGVPFAAAILLVASAFLRLGVSFWPYMIPYSVTVQQAAAPVQSLEFMFWGAGVVVFPVVLIYTCVVYWSFRGKVGKVGNVARGY
jgi:cytochrome d ubiquinol oxidase subunit II